LANVIKETLKHYAIFFHECFCHWSSFRAQMTRKQHAIPIGHAWLSFAKEAHGSENEGLTVCLNACHALTIKRTPGTFAVFTSNGEITTTHNVGLLYCRASALDFLGVPGIELKLANGTISLDEFHRDNAVTSIENKLFNAGGFVHEGLSPAKERKEAGPEGPVKHSKGIVGLFARAVKRLHWKAVRNAAVALRVELQALVKACLVGQHVRGSSNSESP
jgi:hypothetical protein